MSLGDTNNSYNNNKKKPYQPKVYSPYKMSNTESAVDQTQFSTSFWNNMLVLTIAPMVQNNGKDIAFDHDNAASIYLSHTKARMLHDELEMFIQDPHQFNNVGVNSGMGLIYISNGAEFGVTTPVLVVSKINPETGVPESSYAYQFKQSYHYSIRNYDGNTADFDKIYHDNLEIEQLKTLLRSYYEAMTGALAYTVVDNMKYDMSRINTKLDSCTEKLGVEYKGKSTGGNKYGSSGSPFDKSEGRQFDKGTIDDIEGLM
ncbi:MAG: hypothetical protein ACRCXT_18900 [Paraclostridium sp.]